MTEAAAGFAFVLALSLVVVAFDGGRHATGGRAAPYPERVECKADGCDVDGFVVHLSDGTTLDCDCTFNDCKREGITCQR